MFRTCFIFQIIKYSRLAIIKVTVKFVNFKMAYDLIDRNSLFKFLKYFEQNRTLELNSL